MSSEKGEENECALGDAGVGNGEVRGVDDLVPVEEDVDINNARAILEAHHTAHLALDILYVVEELRCGKVGIGGADDIDEPRLLLESDGLAFVDR